MRQEREGAYYGATCSNRGDSGLYLRYGAGHYHGYVADYISGRGEAGGDDTGRSVDEYQPLWYVYVHGESAGRGGYGGCAGSPDAAALYAGAGGDMDSDKAREADRREALSYQ